MTGFRSNPPFKAFQRREAYGNSFTFQAFLSFPYLVDQKSCSTDFSAQGGSPRNGLSGRIEHQMPKSGSEGAGGGDPKRKPGDWVLPPRIRFVTPREISSILEKGRVCLKILFVS